ncbi:MAG: hypothetical protein Q9M37_03545 [Desulfonauticus sp.]|nr:hypothetical protein [Desulfonauticus sp.]
MIDDFEKEALKQVIADKKLSEISNEIEKLIKNLAVKTREYYERQLEIGINSTVSVISATIHTLIVKLSDVFDAKDVLESLIMVSSVIFSQEAQYMFIDAEKIATEIYEESEKDYKDDKRH